MPEMKRQKCRPSAVDWQAMATVEALYQIRDQVKISRRPKRSAAWLKPMVPMKRPAKVAAAKVA